MKDKRNQRPRRRTGTFKLEALEPRLLFSADAASLFAVDDAISLNQPSFSEPSIAALIQQDQTNQTRSEGAKGKTDDTLTELVLIDQSLEDADWIAQQLSAENEPQRVIHFIESERDGVDQISDILARYDSLSSIQLFSHGSDAQLQLGNGKLGMNELLGRADQISGWADALTNEADLLLYGCDLTGSADGRAFAMLLGELTSADIAASENLTGNAALGGDWNLEFRSGKIEADAQLGATTLQDYAGVMDIFEVHNGDNEGVGSLRQAILDANALGGSNQIVFQFSGPYKPTTELPAFTSQISISGTLDINDDVEIILDGSQMLTADANGLSLNNGSNGSSISNLQIINFPGDGIALNDTWAVSLTNNLIGTDGKTLTNEFGNGGNGISLIDSDNNNIGNGATAGANVISGNGLHGLSLSGFITTQNTIDYNFIGTNEDGTSAIGNGGSGLDLEDSASSNMIYSNTISGNAGHGVSIAGEFAFYNVLESNKIGTTADGLAELGNGDDGVRLESGVSYNNIGSNAPGSSNVISGNGNNGITISGDATSNNLVLGNLIGTNLNGDAAIANGLHGVLLYNGAQNNEIGGGGDYESNVISGNAGNGITIDGESGTTTIGNLVLGNYIGTDTTATLELGNTVAGIDIINGASNNRIGGDRTTAQANVIVANEYGIKLGAVGTDGNSIYGNYLGTNASDSISLGNTEDGVNIWGAATNTVIGGTGNGEGNVISGNAAGGISITGEGTDGTIIKANLIGTNSAGTTALGNGNNGIGLYSGASLSIIGGNSSTGEGNLISGNGVNGIELYGLGTEDNLIQGNRIGTNLNGDSAIENESNGIEIIEGASNNIVGGSFLDNTGNLISGNANAGITLDGSSATTSGNIITGNRIGTNASGDAKLPNSFGIYNFGATNTQIGSAVAGEENIVSGNTHNGIKSMTGASSLIIQGNYIGTDATASTLIGNGQSGIHIHGATGDIAIGGTGEEGNIISGNGQYGVTVQDSRDIDIKGNYIGVDDSGFIDIGNTLSGIYLYETSSNILIGGSLDGEGNILSGNGLDGITMDSSSGSNTISGNTIGLAFDEISLLGNAGHGILALSSNNRIGGTSSNERNTIAANLANGIRLDTGATGNALLGNSIWQNGEIGIDLGGDGVTTNDENDVDSGANNLQNFPQLTEVITDEMTSLQVQGTLQSSSGTTFRIEFFTSTTLDASGHGDARELAGYTTVTTDGNGDASFQALFSAIVANGEYVTATATVDNGSAGFGETSEYSASLAASGNTNNTAPEFSLGSGYHHIDLNATSSDAVDMTTQSDGKYLVLSKVNSADASGKYDFALTRFNADGSIDSGFGNGGTTISDLSPLSQFAKALSLQGDGKIIVAGNRDLGSYDEAIMFRYNVDGSLDTSFGTAGEANFNIPGTEHTALKDITLMTDGRIVGTGYVTIGGEDSMVVIRTTASGELDTSFNGSGYKIIDTGTGDAAANALQLQTDGKIVLIGQRDNGSTDETRVVRLNVDGTLDTTFSGDGHLKLVSSDNLSPLTIAIASDGKIVLGGNSDGAGIPTQIVRLLSNGSLDSSFGGAGYVNIEAGDADETAINLIIDNEGRIVVVGDVHNGSNDDISIVRLNNDGTLDTTLDGDGLVRLDLSGSTDRATTVVVDANGNLTIAGKSGGQIFIASILENGSLDNRFHVESTLTGSAAYTEDAVAIVLDSNVTAYDRELSAADNFAGATLTLARETAVNSDDVFGFNASSGLSLDGNQILKNSAVIASFDTTSVSGQLSITFTDSNGEVPTNADVTTTLQNITYLNTNNNPSTQVTLDWTLKDGNTGMQGNGDNLSASGQTIVNLTATNDNPDITSDGGTLSADITINEGASQVTVVTANDVDTGAVLTYSIVGGTDKNSFTMDSGSGELSFITAPDHETQTEYQVIVKASDEGGASDFQVIDVSIADINESPEFVTSSSLPDATQDTPYSTTIVTSDPDTGDTLHFNNAAIPIWLSFTDGGDGTATLSGTPNDNHTGPWLITLEVEDAAGLTSMRTFSLIVQKANDAPEITSDEAFVLTENTPTAGFIEASDIDGDPLTFAIVGGADSAVFDIDTDTGELTFRANPDFESSSDSDGDNVYQLIVSADDGTGSSNSVVTQSITVTVTDLPDEDLAPITDLNALAGEQGIIDENSVIGSTVGITASTVDGDSGQTIKYDLSGTDAALFSIDSDGVVTTALTLDHERADQRTFIVTAISTDDSTISREFTVNIVDVNEAPIFTTSPNLPDATEDSVYSTIITTSDPDTADPLTFNYVSLPVWMSLVDNGDGTATLSGTPQNSHTGSWDIELEVEDAAGLTSTRVFSLTVENVNDAPVFTSETTFTVSENTLDIDRITATDIDGNTPGYAITGGSDAALFNLDSDTGQLSFSASPDFETPQDTNADQTYELIISADDGTASPDSVVTQAITVTVLDLPDEDLANITDIDSLASEQGIVDENSPIGSTVGITAMTIDGDAGQDISYVLSGTDADLFSIDAGGIIRTAALLNHEAAAQHHFTVSATSTDGSSTTRDFTVSVADVNEAPTFTTLPTLPDAVEDSAYTATFYTRDPEVADTRTFTAVSLPGWLTMVDNDDGTATLTGTPQNNDVNTFFFSLEIEDSGGLKSTRTFSLVVNNVNDAPVFTSDTAFTISENARNIDFIRTTDIDGDTPSYAIAGGNDASLFSIDATTGELSFSAPADYETPQDANSDQTYELIISADDGTDSVDAVVLQSITVTVADLPDEELTPITDTNTLAGDQGTVDENRAVGSTVGITAFTTDGDAGQTISYALTGTDAALFSIDANGVIRTTTVLNHETAAQLNFSVTAVSTDSSSATRDFTVNVDNVNEAPVFNTASSLPDADQDNAYSVTISTADPDAADTRAFTSIDMPDWLSLVDNDDGTATLIGTPENSDTGAFSFTLTVEDAAGLKSARSFSLIVNNINDAPVFTSDTAYTIAENTRDIDTAAASDIDGDALSFAIAGGSDATLFSIDNSTGQLRFSASPDYENPQDADKNRTYELIISADDGTASANAVALQSITVTVVDLPDEELYPIVDIDTLAGDDGRVDENSAIGSTVGITAMTQDGDVGQSVSYALSGPDAALFSIDTNGVIRTAAVLNYETAAQRSFSVTANSTDGSTATQNFIVGIVNANERPVFGSDSDLPAATQDIAYSVTINTADPDVDDTRTILAVSLPHWLSLVDNGDGTATLGGTPKNSDAGLATFTLEVIDDAGLTDTRTFNLIVTDVNDAPSITSAPTLTVAENEQAIGIITATDIDGDILYYAITGGNDASLFTLDGHSGELSFSVVPDYENPQDLDKDGQYQLTISVDDGSGRSGAITTQLLTVTVSDTADEALTAIIDLDTTDGNQGSIDENSDSGATVGITAYSIDGDAGQSISYALSGTDAAFFSIDANGTVTTTTRLDHESAANRSFLVTAISSDGSTLTRSFIVSVNDVNEAPAFTTDTSLPDAIEGSAYIVTINSRDLDSGDSQVITSIAPPGWLSLIDNADGTATLSGTPDHSDIGAHTITLTVTDTAGLASTRTFTLQVENINNAPVLLSGSTFSVDENSDEVTTITASDEDDDALRYSIAGGIDADLFTIDSVSGVLSFAMTPDFENAQDADNDNIHHLIIQVTDGSNNDNAVARQAITVTIKDLQDETLSAISDIDQEAGEQGFVNENSAIGTSVGITANTADGDIGQSIRYALSGANASLFSIDEDGMITSNAPFDYETAKRYDVRVTATSDDGSTATRLFSIDIGNVNEAPVITSASSLTIVENTRSAATVVATDIDADSLTYEISGGRDAGEFEIHSETGELSFTRNPDFERSTDANQDNQYELVITARDTSNAAAHQTLIVTVTDINESPVISTTKIQSTSSHDGNIGTLNISDPDNGDTVELTIIGGDSSSAFTYDAATDQLKQVSQLVKGSYTLEVILVDSNGNSTRAELTITILDDPLLQAALPDTTIDADTLDSLEATIETAVSHTYTRVTEPPPKPPQTIEQRVQETTEEHTAEVEESQQTDDVSNASEQWNDILLGDTSAEAVLENNRTDNQPSGIDTGQGVSRSESREKARLLDLMNGLQKQGLITSQSILEKFQILPFQLTLAPSMHDGDDALTQELSETAREQTEQQQLVVAIGAGASVAFTAGFVSWLLKAGVLVSTAKSSAPLWSAIDPVPVLHKREIT